MDRTWTIRIEVENEEGEILTDYKYVGVDSVPKFAHRYDNLMYIVIKMFQLILDKIKDKGWL